ncbi:5984_t:CDS:2 [Acaulospora colombiana]|uniref:5984_t:CDS:1 n=1 Tax=Acaulospora colombiana TaxID=27376 RepID=A0ACA9LBF8_9GLOM|nr:5984_t:CDS:2 [Acaulospora colombiana]
MPMSNKEPPQLLSSSFVQPELSSQSQGYAHMSDNGYPPQDQFVMNSQSFAIPEPPPYEQDFNSSSILDPEDQQFIFGAFLDNLQANPNYLFSPSLPPNMPMFPSPTDNSVNGLLNPMRSVTLSSNSEEKDGSAIQSVPAKRKQTDEDDKSRRRSSSHRISPINTKLSMTQTNNNNDSTSSPRPISPPMQLSNLSGNTPSSSANGSPSPRTPNRELTKNEEESGPLGNLTETSSNDNDNTTDDFTEIKSESKPTPQKSSRKPYKELLTEEEKRANHIASEQKRRNTIRAGFKELTDIIPTLKNVNNSKSTILFKAVDYIKYLERRNKNLKERAGLLEMRVEMEMRQGKRFHHGGFGPTMGFGHQRVGPMPIGTTYGMMHNSMNGMNGMNGMNSINGAENQPMATQQQMISGGNTVSSVNQTNNVFRNGMQIQQPQHSINSETNNNNGLVPGMKIPNDDDQEMMNHHHNGVDHGMVGAEHDGDSMMVLNGSASRVGVKCL